MASIGRGATRMSDSSYDTGGMRSPMSAVLSVVSARSAASLLLYILLRDLVVPAVLLLPLPLRLFGALHAVAPLPSVSPLLLEMSDEKYCCGSLSSGGS
jgi:hypothetical protein